MKAEDDLTRAKLSALPERAAIAARLKELLYIDAQSVPISARRTGSSTRTARRRRRRASSTTAQGRTGTEKILLDPNTWSKDGSSSLHSWSVSWDGKRIAYNRSENNSDETTMHLLDIDSGKESAIDVIPGAKYAYASWTPKGDGFYYVHLPVDPTIPIDRP